MELPHTPAGRHAAWILDHLGKMLRGGEIRARFAPSFLEKISPLKVRAITLALKVYLPVETRGIRESDHTLLVALSTAQGPATLRVVVEPDEPHRMTGLSIRPPTVLEIVDAATPGSDVDALLDEHLGAYARGLRGADAGAVAAVQHADVTTVRAFGAAKPDAIFEVGSITKTATATLLAEMCAAGEVALDDHVAKYLPVGSSMPTSGADITLLELATHSSGLPRLPVNYEPDDEDDPYAGFTNDVLFSGLAQTPVTGRGEATYSNLGYALLGQVLARVAGTTYEALATSRVLEPFGMTTARFGADPGLLDRVDGHRAGKVVPHWTLAAVTPAGGIEACALDMLAYVVAHCSATPGSPTATTHRPRLPYDAGMQIGLAWIIAPTAHGDVLWHNGGTGGFQSFAGFHPASGTSIIVLSNTSDEPAPDVAAASVLGALIAVG